MSHKKKVLQGSASNLMRVLLSMLVAFVLPPFLVHRMPPSEYSAWVLILQISAYVNILDLGLQTAIGKFVAQYDASGDREANRLLLSTSFAVLAIAASFGAAVIGVVSWQIPRLFHQMPAALVPEVRLGLLAVGLSTALLLPFSIFLSSFTGLQRYLFPTAVAGASRIASAAGLIVLLLRHGSLTQLAMLLAGFNVTTAGVQFFGWKKYASDRVPFSFLGFDRDTAIRLAKYGGIITLWTLSTLFISGLDIVIVGRYDYKSTGFYAIASTATNFMLVVATGLFSPLLPAISALQSANTPGWIGQLVIKTTRYSGLLLCLLGLPLILGAYPLLSLWVGHRYALESALFLEVLVAGNIIRQLGYPYSLAVLATGRQHLATISPLAEAMVNFLLSIWLAQRIGALGVAIGTLVGAFVSLGVHLGISMHYTQPTILIPRSRFLWQGLLRPLSCIIPSLLLYHYWRSLNLLPFAPVPLAAWAALTLAIMWTVGLNATERPQLRKRLFKLVLWRPERT